MDEIIIETYCLCDNLSKAICHQEDCQCQMNEAEIIPTALTAALFFPSIEANLYQHESARKRLRQPRYRLGSDGNDVARACKIITDRLIPSA